MKTLAIRSLAFASITGVALAADKGAGAGLPGNAPGAAAPAVTGAVLAVRKAGTFKVPVKTSKSGRGGGKSPYPFDQLEIGDSFGVVGKTKKNFNSIVYGANQRHMEPVFEADGVTPKMVSKTDRKTKIVSQVQAKRPTRVFEAFDVDPKTDEDGASVRIVRQPLPPVAAS